MLLLLLLLSVIASASVGSASITMKDSLKLLFSKIPFIGGFIDVTDLNGVYETIVWKVRLPRILLASLVGGGLAAVGCTFQAIFRNSLADPHILGVSSGAALGATLSILSEITLNVFGIGVTSIFAFFGAIIAVFIVYQIGGLGGKMVISHLLLTGTAISTMLSAMISLLMIYNREQLEKVYLWTLGSFTASNWSKVTFLFVVSVITVIILFIFCRELNVMLTGDEIAESLGIDIVKLKKLLIIVAATLVATSVSVSGLIIPHCMRILVGSDHRRLLPVSYLGGAIFMIVCDTIARTIAQPTEIPVGVITAVFGAPYFIFLLYRSSKTGKL